MIYIHTAYQPMLNVIRKGRWTTYRVNEDYEQKPEQLNFSDMPEVAVELNKTDRTIYEFVLANKMITTQQVVDIVDSISTIQGALRAINRLIQKDLLEKKKQGRNYFYVLKQ